MTETKTLSVEERLEAIEKQNADQALEMESLKKENIELKKKLSGPDVKEKEKVVIPDKPFTYKKDGKSTKYVFTVPFIMWKGQRISATDAMNTPEIQAALVEKKSGSIKEYID